MTKQGVSVQVNIVSFEYGMQGVSDRQKYSRSLLEELKSAADYAEDYEVQAFYLSGVSPLQYPVDALVQLIQVLKQNITFMPSAEMTVEALPGSVTYADLQSLAEEGVNRIRFDMRTFVPSELDALGRTYAPRALEVFMRMVQLKIAFFNYEVALYYGLPGQTIDSLRFSIEQAIRFMGTGVTLLPYADDDPAQNLAYYQAAINEMESHGYQPYTPNHFTRPGYTSLWNQLAYSYQPHLGFGAGAVSQIDGTISRNTADVEAYMAAKGDPEKLIARLEAVSQDRLVSQALLDSLYNLRAFDISILNPTQYKAASALNERGLLQVSGSSTSLTESGKANWPAVARVISD